jgi:glycosyltransferase involved in cell wall biosynthesis
MKVALVGTRGVPANYGGFETCAEELARGLVVRGHDVTVYCRPGNAPGDPATFEGARLVYLPYIDRKSLGTLSHTFRSLVHAVREDFDVLMVFNAGNAPLCVLPRLLRQRVVINVDGLEWRRAKWGRAAKLYYQFGEWAATKLADRIISDSRVIQSYYLDRFRTSSTYIAYGAHIEGSLRPEILDEYGLEPDGYFFMGSRLEPENHADLVVEAFEHVRTDKLLAIAGSANWDSPFIRRLKARAGSRVRLLGGVYAPGHMRELHANCYAYVHAAEVGGTNPALVKAMGYANCVLSVNIPFNAETVADAGLMFEMDPVDLARKMQLLVDDPSLVEHYRERAPLRVKDAYQWPVVVDDYESVFERVIAGRLDRHSPQD